MLPPSIHSLLIRSLWCSGRIRDVICEKLLGASADKALVFKSMLYNELRQLGQERWRSDEYQTLAEDNADFTRFLKTEFHKLFHHYFIQDGMFIHARQERLTEYEDTFRYIHPYILIASYLSEILLDNSDSSETHSTIEHIEELSENILENALEHRHDKEYAENHCHIGGAYDCNVALLCLLERRKERSLIKTPSISFGAQDFDNEKEQALFQWSFAFINEWLVGNVACKPEEQSIIKPISKTMEYQQYLKQLLKHRLPLDYSQILDAKGLETILVSKPVNSRCQMILLRFLKQLKRNHYDSALLLYLTAVIYQLNSLKATKNGFSTALPNVVSLFLMQINILRSEMIMNRGNGLKDFVEFFNSEFRKSGNHHQNPARALFMSGVTSVECRSASLPKMTILPDIFSEIDRTLEHHFPESLFADRGRDKHNIIHPSQQILLYTVGYHFKKEAKPYNLQVETVRKDTDSVISFLRKESNNIPLKSVFASLRHPSADKCISSLHFDLRLLLRTLDAAGDENLTPPEIFAPYAKQIREYSQSTFACNEAHKRSRRLCFAFHAGENFSHIVTGMRRVHETIEFLQYERHDRLGHALAIGISPIKWMKLKREVLLTFEEHFDNCLWLYNMALRIAELTNNFVGMIDIYKNQLIKLLNEINTKSIDAKANNETTQNNDKMTFSTDFTIEQYWQAYQERSRLWDKHYSNKYNSKSLSNDVKKICQSYLRRHSVKDSEKDKISPLWFKKIILKHCEGNASEMAYSNIFRYEVVTDIELTFWEAVQDYLLRLCAQKEIIIEANPSSNVAISDLDSYDKHPLSRWNPIDDNDLSPHGKYNKWGLRKGSVDICINSDDPGIFTTTLQNEFRLIRETAIKQYPASQVNLWLDNIRKRGLEIFNSNYICPFN